VVQFEYDPNKSEANKEKHGIDFEEAKALWSDPRAVEFLGRVKDYDEVRLVRIGRIGGRGWAAVFTIRGPDVVRLISVRRARRDERRFYE
jgi:uncharacterized DUF497 family protein